MSVIESVWIERVDVIRWNEDHTGSVRATCGELLNPIVTELTTAATDLGLGLMAVGGLLWLRGRMRNEPRRWIWTAILMALGASGTLGAAAHGLRLPEGLHRVAWAGVVAGLSVAAALFPVAALIESHGWAVARRWLPGLLVAGLGAWILSQVSERGIDILLVFAGVAALVALGLFLTSKVRDSSPGTGLLAGAVLLNLVASAVQANGTLRVRLILPFDHNGVCHLIQMLGLVMLLLGVDRLSCSRSDRSRPGPIPTEARPRTP